MRLRTSRIQDREDGLAVQTVVIVDDRVTNLRILERLAASMDGGLSILTFDNPQTALDAITLHVPDLVITDFKMPDLDGAEFIRQIRARPACGDVPVMVVTAYEDRDLRYRALDAGATDFLLSPVDHHEFRARSRNLLLLRRQQLLLKQRASSLEERIQVETRAHQEALRRSHDLLLRVIDVVPVMISAVDAAGRYIFANATLREFLGKTDDEIIGRMPDEVAPGARPKAGGARSSYEEALVSADGRECVLLTTKSALPGDSENDGTLMVTVSVDISDRKEAEASLLAAKELAEVASRSKSDFLANMSHELRTPLNAIIGFSQVMVDEMFGPIGARKYIEYADDIGRSARHLLAIINDILDVSKLEAGKLELDEDIVDLRQVADEILHLVEDQARSSNIRFDLAGFDGPPRMRGDNRIIRQILLNLVSNAVKFSEPGGAVCISTLLRGGELVMTVADSGIGMDQSEVEIAVTRFGQVGSPWNRRHRGTGLGLPLAISLVELHGGRVEIESDKGQGTTVMVAFPESRVVTDTLGDVNAQE